MYNLKSKNISLVTSFGIIVSQILFFSNICMFTFAGAYPRLRDSFCRRCRLLSRVECDSVGG